LSLLVERKERDTGLFIRVQLLQEEESMDKLVVAAVVAMSLSCAGEGLADAGQFYIAPGLQGMNYDDELGVDNDRGGVIGIGYDFTSRLSGEFSVADLDPKIRGGGEIDQDLWKVDLLYGLDVAIGRFSPFVVSGLGNSNIHGENDSIWDVGAGLRLPLSERLTWRTSLRNYYFLGRDFEDSDLGWESSLVYRFGGSNQSARPQTPEPIASGAQTRERPIDSDRDGVADDQDKCPDTPLSYAVDDSGCPIPVEEVARVELLVNFAFDKAEVRPEYYSEIEGVARFMRQYPDVVVELEGHTDNRGTDEYNLGLSQRRANAVMGELVNRFDVAASRVSARGFGESQPVTSNASDAGRAENRRVITVIIKTLQRYQPR
jgi:OOP family OmpA-OmpF porin